MGFERFSLVVEIQHNLWLKFIIFYLLVHAVRLAYFSDVFYSILCKLLFYLHCKIVLNRLVYKFFASYDPAVQTKIRWCINISWCSILTIIYRWQNYNISVVSMLSDFIVNSWNHFAKVPRFAPNVQSTAALVRVPALISFAARRPHRRVPLMPIRPLILLASCDESATIQGSCVELFASYFTPKPQRCCVSISFVSVPIAVQRVAQEPSRQCVPWPKRINILCLCKVCLHEILVHWK